MILVGQYDSPFVRRVAISLRLLSFAYEHDTRSVFGDFDSMRTTNPLGRIPSLILDDGNAAEKNNPVGSQNEPYPCATGGETRFVADGSRPDFKKKPRST